MVMIVKLYDLNVTTTFGEAIVDGQAVVLRTTSLARMLPSTCMTVLKSTQTSAVQRGKLHTDDRNVMS